MKALRWTALLTVALACSSGIRAQPSAAPAAGADPCPADAQSLPLEALFGRWELRVDGQPGVAIVEMARHPEYAGVRGTVAREGGGLPSQLAGDIDDEGLLTIDQSDDGHAISATWSGSVQSASCGKVFEGTWRKASDESGAHFVLRKLSSASGITKPTNN
jgi:hypothetical protein